MIYWKTRGRSRPSWALLCVYVFVVLLNPGSLPGQNRDQHESVPALWQQSLSATRLTGYKDSERLIVSNIWTGMLGRDAVVKHTLRVKVDTWAKRFTTVYVSPDKKNKESLSVTLYKTTNSREMSAHFEHIVYEKGEIKLRFCGITRMNRI